MSWCRERKFLVLPPPYTRAYELRAPLRKELEPDL